MPVKKASSGKYRVGSGPAVFTTKKDAEAAQRAIKAKESEKNKRR